MGTYLSTPVLDKHSEDGSDINDTNTPDVRWAVVDMQVSNYITQCVFIFGCLYVLSVPHTSHCNHILYRDGERAWKMHM